MTLLSIGQVEGDFLLKNKFFKHNLENQNMKQ